MSFMVLNFLCRCGVYSCWESPRESLQYGIPLFSVRRTLYTVDLLVGGEGREEGKYTRKIRKCRQDFTYKEELIITGRSGGP